MSQVTDSEQTELAGTLDTGAWLREHCAIRPVTLAVAAYFSVFFLYHNYIPLFHSDIWGHVAYGNWILDHGKLPAEEPFVPLAEGVPVVCTAWLGQVVFAVAGRAGGPEWHSNLFALVLLASYLVLAAAFRGQSGRIGIAACGACLAWLINWSRHAIVRPEVFGGLCFAVLIWLVVRADPDRSRRPGPPQESNERRVWPSFLGVPLLFAVWANLHGSFIVGYAVLGCYCLGRALQVLWRQRSLRALAADRLFRRWLLLGELAVGASLVNPYGMDLLVHTLLFPSNPNLNEVLEWFRLTMISMEGVQVGLSIVLMLALFRHSRARILPADVLLLAVFGLAVCLRVRMTAWYAPVVVLVLMPHLADVTARLGERFAAGATARKLQAAARPSFPCALIACLVVWIAFAFSPISRFALGGKPRPDEHLYSKATPLALTEYLREHPPEGPVFNPQWWGDWLAWKGPPDLAVFMTTNSVHVAPARVWNDYLAIARAESSAAARLGRYRVNTIVLHKELQPSLDRYVRRSSSWKIVYEDDLGLIAERTRVHAGTADESSDDPSAESDHEPQESPTTD